MNTSTTINPYTGEKEATYNRITEEQTLEAIADSNKAYKSWRKEDFSSRARYMKKLGDLLEERAEEYGELITKEMGKVKAQAVGEMKKCAWICRYYAEHAEEFLSNDAVESDASKSYVCYEPIGVILAVMPWNFPFYQVIRFLAPTLMAGNTSLLKHASNVQGCAEALESAVLEAGFPKGVFKNINIDTELVEKVIADDSVRAVTLTGSEGAGRAVAENAGKHIKKSVLELGGSDPYIILDDVDLKTAVELSVTGRLQNTGQTCIAAKRFIVLDGIYDDFVTQFTAAMENAQMGDPMADDVDYGPMAREDLRNELHEQVETSIEQGAVLKTGGKVPERVGAFYPATVLADVKPGMVAFDEELFGPVAAVIKAKDEDHAIELANNSTFGLASGVFSKDNDRAEKVARQIEAGTTFINATALSDPRLPFGGVKNSGYGRELSHFGIKEFVNIKTIWIK